ncbi:MAG: anaerobic ribonucleoside-triphosphate reductase activating protein [Lachnospiraceae bacterium]|nr:anaerobic ribonucleoside-triphosphate reductase activating protein [Lachnospiraceae bacterium]
MNYADIKQYDVANGPGIRISLFVSGCTHHCKGCFNREAWDFNYGKSFTDETIDTIIEYMKPPYISGLTLLGGDPMEPSNIKALLPLLRRIKEVYPNKNIWCFTGYEFEKDILGEMIENVEGTKEFISYIDVLVDGKYVEALHSVNLKFKGSSNQKTIMVQESLKTGKTILWNPPEYVTVDVKTNRIGDVG